MATTSSPQPILDIADASITFGGIRALKGVSLRVHERELCGLIGPNGAGKTTLFNCITRLYDLGGGRMIHRGRDITRLPRRAIVKAGIARTFQNLGLYPQMSVMENVLVGTHCNRRDGFFSPLLCPWLTRAEERRSIEWCGQILRQLQLDAIAGQRADELPYGTLKRIELARALAARPSLLLLDEPAAGLTQGEVTAFGELLRDVRDRFGISILLVEHNMRLVMNLCDRIVALHLGSKLAEGTPAEIQKNELVARAYLGES